MKPELDLEQRLLQATSQHPAHGDAQLESLQAGFLALGRGLESATTAEDEARLLARLRGAPKTVAAPASESNWLSKNAPLVWLAALAALLLIGLGITWLNNQSQPALGPTLAQPTQPAAPVAPPDADQESSAESAPATELVENQPAATEAPAATAATADAWAWDDALDETFTSLQQQVRSAGNLASGTERRLENLNERIQSAADDFDPASL
jgi:hypothetical protein